jgi:hypothetical protein
MAFRHPSDVYTRQNRASTAPGPMPPSFPRDAAIPPSLIPGFRHRQTISVANGADNLLFPQPDRGKRTETGRVSATVTAVGGMIPGYYYVSPSPCHGLTPPQPPPIPPQQQQAALPPLPPKAAIIPPSMSPILPPKPPPFMPSPPFSHPPMPRSKSQPPPPLPRGASPPFNSPPPRPPPVLPPKPHGARSTSVIVTPSYLRFPSAMPREKASPDTSDTASLILPSMSSPMESPLEPPVANEEEELELALKLSAHAEREYTDSLLSQDEALARALEESLLDSADPRPAKQKLSRATTASALPASSSTRPLEIHPYSPKQPPPFPLPVRTDSSTTLASLASGQIEEDEAYARKLAAEAGYDSGRSTPTTMSNHNVDQMEGLGFELPRYSDIVKDTDTFPHGGTINVLPKATPHLESEATEHVPHVSATPTSDERDAVPHQTTPDMPPQQRSSSSQRPSPRPASLALSLSASEEEETPESPSTPARALRAVPTPNQYIEPELLYGVCKC